MKNGKCPRCQRRALVLNKAGPRTVQYCTMCAYYREVELEGNL